MRFLRRRKAPADVFWGVAEVKPNAVYSLQVPATLNTAGIERIMDAWDAQRPDSAKLLILSDDLTFSELTDEQLAHLGLMRTPKPPPPPDSLPKLPQSAFNLERPSRN